MNTENVAGITGIEMLLVDGMTINQIAEAIGVKPDTVRRIRRGAMPSTATWQKINWLLQRRAAGSRRGGKDDRI